MVERKPEQESSSMLGGWVPVKGQEGMFTSAKKPEIHMTEEFKSFAELSQARWDLLEYLKVNFRHLLKRIIK
jgi:hypothetical protein